MLKTPKYQKRASDSYIARQKAAGKVRFSKWVPRDLVKQLMELIANYKG